MGNAAAIGAMGAFVPDDMLPGSPLIKREQSNVDAGEFYIVKNTYFTDFTETGTSETGAGMMTPQQTPKNTSPSQQSPSIGNSCALSYLSTATRSSRHLIPSSFRKAQRIPK